MTITLSPTAQGVLSGCQASFAQIRKAVDEAQRSPFFRLGDDLCPTALAVTAVGKEAIRAEAFRFLPKNEETARGVEEGISLARTQTELFFSALHHDRIARAERSKALGVYVYGTGVFEGSFLAIMDRWFNAYAHRLYDGLLANEEAKAKASQT